MSEIVSSKELLPTLRRLAVRLVPRMLTQVCRDETDPTYGCFDRNWWHYKIRDFPSVILQQGGYAIYEASKIGDAGISGAFARNIANASAIFWNKRAIKHGAFEEYYPWEQGYPPLAFSTLAVAKLVHEGVVDAEAVRAGMKIAARQLCERFEPKAVNQQVAGLAALAFARKLYPEFVAESEFADVAEKTLAQQTAEGWFWEYDGPDVGYLSVTLDCLWDLFDVTGDAKFRTSADKAFDFINETVALSGGGLGMLNARNTDYIVPYGIARYLRSGADAQKKTALSLLDCLYKNIDAPSHFFNAVDDRYWVHYIGHSLMRAVNELQEVDEYFAASEKPAQGEKMFDVCGYVFDNRHETRHVALALNKGGCVSIREAGQYFVDLGVAVDVAGKTYVSHWWSKEWRWQKQGNAWIVAGALVPHKNMQSGPWKHIALRLMSFAFGKSLIATLKNVLIFKKSKSPYTFLRLVEILPDEVRITDEIMGAKLSGKNVAIAKRQSKRHVASADSFHPEDDALSNGFVAERRFETGKDCVKIHTVVRNKK